MKKRRRLKKRPILVLICIIILTTVISIFTINTINELKYRETLEYKLLQIGYNKNEIELLKEKTNTKFMNSLLETEYDEMYLSILKEKYYISENVSKYIDYYENNLNTSSYDTVAIVNIGADKETYTNIKKSDLSKDIQLINNKHYQLPNTYVPEDLIIVKNWYSYGSNVKLREIAYNSFINMHNEAKKNNLTIIINSAYRSYDSQKEIYDDYLAKYNEEYADTYVARPGHSEHQTGLAIDVTTYGSNGKDFDQTKEFKWLQDNAHLYGFILRYPKDKEYITGYGYESWHYRYVGIEIATKIHEENITFDEYYAYYINNV